MLNVPACYWIVIWAIPRMDYLDKWFKGTNIEGGLLNVYIKLIHYVEQFRHWFDMYFQSEFQMNFVDEILSAFSKLHIETLLCITTRTHSTMTRKSPWSLLSACSRFNAPHELTLSYQRTRDNSIHLFITTQTSPNFSASLLSQQQWEEVFQCYLHFPKRGCWI